MEDEQLREFAALDRDVARIVVHGLRRVQPLELAAGRLRLEDQGRQLPGAGVHAGRQTGGATPDDDDVVDHERQRQRRFLLKRCPRKGDRGTKGHGYLMMEWIIIAGFGNPFATSAIPLNSWCRLWGGAEGMWHGLHQEAIPSVVRGRRGGYVHRLRRAELRGRRRGPG